MPKPNVYCLLEDSVHIRKCSNRSIIEPPQFYQSIEQRVFKPGPA
jgi:hypothetical protein